MSYVIATWKENKPYAIHSNVEAMKFELIPLDSQGAINRMYSNPHRAGAQQILTWIKSNDTKLNSEDLKICDESQFRK